MERLDGRIALVTGGTGALGQHVVPRFLEADAEVHVPARDAAGGAELKRLISTGGGPNVQRLSIHEGTDLSRPDEVDALLSHIRAACGRGPDILLDLAGGFAMAPVEDTPPEAWDRMLRINATTAFLVSRAVFGEMKRRGWGRIVTMAALPALEGGGESLGAYAAAKAAVLNLTGTLSREGAGHGVTANAILPSIIDTPANREAMPDADTSAWIPPDEIADLCLFLCSDRARVLTGASLTLRLD